MTMPAVSSSVVEEIIVVARESDLAYVQARARAFASGAGLRKRAAWAAAIVASELATNILKFGAPGRVTFRVEPGASPFLDIEAEDCGTGWTDIEFAMRDGVSEGVDRSKLELAPASRRGLGLGLGAVRRLADELEISVRSAGGSIVTARIRVNRLR